MKAQGRLVGIFYSAYEDRKPDLTLLIRESPTVRKQIIVPSPIYPYFMVRREYSATVKEGLDTNVHSITPTKDIGLFGEELDKFEVYNPQNVGALRRKLHTLPFLEADIVFANRVMYDSNFGLKIRVEDDNTIVNIDKDVPSPRKMYWDIENWNKRQGLPQEKLDRIISIAAVTDDGQEFFFCHDSEKKMLQDFLNFAKQFDKWIGFNSGTDDEGWDLKWLKARCRMNGVSWNIQAHDYPDIKILYNSARQQKTESDSLEFIAAFEGLTHRKVKVTKPFWQLFEEDREQLRLRNMTDCWLTKELDEKFGFTDIREEIAEHVGIWPSTKFYRGYVVNNRIIDAILLRKCQTRKPRIVAPSRKRLTEEERKSKAYEGAEVLVTVPGVHHNIIHLDYAGLYNSIIRTFNLSPEFWKLYGGDKTPEDIIKFFSQIPEQGIFPEMLEETVKLRNHYKQLKKTAKTKEEKNVYTLKEAPLKTLLQLSYGQLGEKASRWYVKELAETVTWFDRYIVPKTKEYLESQDMKILYGDTDSMFIALPVHLDSMERYLKVGEHLVDKINNEFLPSLLAEFGVSPDRSKLLIDFETVYKTIFFGEAKKKYAGVPYDSEDAKVVGFETIRSDWCTFAKLLQRNVLDILLKKESGLRGTLEYLEREKERFFKGKYNHLLVINKGLRQDIEEYKSLEKGQTPPPHVRAAQKMIERGIPITDIKIPFVITSYSRDKTDVEPVLEGVIPPIEKSGLDYYWTNQVFPPAQRLLEVLVTNPDEGNRLTLLSKVEVKKKEMLDNWT